jgi:hypothetical protein
MIKGATVFTVYCPSENEISRNSIKKRISKWKNPSNVMKQNQEPDPSEGTSIGIRSLWLSATLKAVAVNIFRATAVRRALNNEKAVYQRRLLGYRPAIFVIKEHALMAWSQLRNIFTLFGHRYGHPLKMAG